MKFLNEYIIERGFFKNVGATQIKPKDKQELVKIIDDTISKQGLNCDLNFIDTSKIGDMSALFYGSDFTGDISKWDVSGVKDMSYMFDNSTFNGDISKWDVSNVEYMDRLFRNSKLERFNKLPKWYKR